MSKLMLLCLGFRKTAPVVSAVNIFTIKISNRCDFLQSLGSAGLKSSYCREFTCTNKKGNFVKGTDTSGYFLYDQFIHLKSFWILSSVLISHFWLLPGLILMASLWHAGSKIFILTRAAVI